MLDKKTDREGRRDPCRSEDWIYRRGDIYLANLNPFKGSEQGGTRPVWNRSRRSTNAGSRSISVK